MTQPTTPESTIAVRVLAAHEAAVLDHVADDVFDHAIDAVWCAAFFADPRHHLAVAMDGDLVIGFASGVRYVHPDKPDQLFINEAGVSDAYQNRGIGRTLLHALLAHAATLGCEGAWVLTEADNTAARRMYAAAGGIEAAEAPIMIEFTT